MSYDDIGDTPVLIGDGDVWEWEHYVQRVKKEAAKMKGAEGIMWMEWSGIL